MKKKVIFAFLLGITSLVGCNTVTDAPEGITIFETTFTPGDSTAISDWDVFDGNGALRRTWASFSTDAPSGSANALVLSVPAPDHPQYVNAMRLLPSLEGTHRYRLSLWMKREGSSWAGFGSAKLDRSSTTGAIRSWGFRTGAGATASDAVWKSYSVEDSLTIPSGDSLAVYLRVDSLAGKFGLIRLERLE